jgi:hypothetical protein
LLTYGFLRFAASLPRRRARANARDARPACRHGALAAQILRSREVDFPAPSEPFVRGPSSGVRAGEADWARVFEPFYRDLGALRRRTPGHGLGLALVRHIAQCHGGSATFRHGAGPGARLEIVLPEMNQ